MVFKYREKISMIRLEKERRRVVYIGKGQKCLGFFGYGKEEGVCFKCNCRLVIKCLLLNLVKVELSFFVEIFFSWWLGIKSIFKYYYSM